MIDVPKPHATPDRPGSPQSTPRSGRIVLLTLALTVVCTLPMFLVGALAVQMRAELDFSVAALGIAVAVYRGAGAVFAAPLGRLSDRLGPGPAMRISAAIATGVGLGVALFARSWLTLCLFLVFGGIANALGQTGSNLLLVRAVRQGRQGFAFGLKQSALPVGSVIAGLTVPLIALTVGWRWAFVLAAAAAVAVGLAVPSSRDVRFQASTGAANRARRRTPLVVIAVALFFAMCAASTLSAFTVDAAVTAGVSPANAGLLLTLGGMIAIATRLGAGMLADRREGAHFAVVAKMLFAGAVGYLFLALANPWGFAVGTILAFGLGWGFNGLFWFAVVRFNQATPGKATGMVMPGGLFGGLIGPIVFGWTVEAATYPVAWVVAAVWAAIGGVLMLWGRRLLRADVAEAAEDG